MLYGLDTAFAPTTAQAQALWDRGWRFFGGYTGGLRATHAWLPDDFTRLAEIGFGFIPIHVGRNAPWDDASGFTEANGRADADRALGEMDARGFGATDHVCLDLEYASYHTLGEAVVPYVAAWCAAINAAGRKAALYSDLATLARFGPDVVDLKWGADWQAGPFAPDPPVGAWDPSEDPPWDAWQFGGTTIDGVSLDLSSARDDYPFVTLAAAPAPVAGRETPDGWPWPTWREAAINYESIAGTLGQKIAAAQAALA